MVFYKGEELTKIAPKNGGKNKSTVDGFYTSSHTGKEYFIKKPADKKELFTELFAGLLLREFMERGLVDEVYCSSLICADLIQFDDGSYGLIQPKVSFTELYKIIGTGYRDGSDRAPITEMLAGPSYYRALIKQGQYFGLSISLMFSLLLGDYSVHSGNVVVLNAEKGRPKQFARIDWGAAFRYFAHENNQDILHPYEYQGWLNPKWFTKGYIDNYKNIAGLFSTIAQKATGLESQLTGDLLKEIVSSALSKIPADMLDEETKIALAGYMSIPAFATASFGPEGNSQEVAEVFSSVLTKRLANIAALQEQTKIQSEDLYQSVKLESPKAPVVLSIDPQMALPELFDLLLEKIAGNQKLDFTQIDLTEVAKQFNHYIEVLAHQAEVFNLWEHDSHSNVNLFARYHTGATEVIQGNAFVAQYRESTVLRRLYTLEPQSLATLGFGSYEEATKAYSKNGNQDSAWMKIETALNYGHGVINYLRQLQKTQLSTESAVNNPTTISQNLEGLKTSLESFTKARQILDEQLTTSSTLDNRLSFESPFFYDLTRQELLAMNGEQLVTICLEELYAATPSPLVARIVTNDTLWQHMETAYSEKTFGLRADNPQDKIRRLKQWRNDYSEFLAHKNNFYLATTLAGKEVEFEDLKKGFDALPEFLKTDEEVDSTFTRAESVLDIWQTGNKIYLEKEEALVNATPQTKSAALNELQQVFATLPADLQVIYQKKTADYREDYQKEDIYLKRLEHHRQTITLDGSRYAFSMLSEVFVELPQSLKQKYQAEFNDLQTKDQTYGTLLEDNILSAYSGVEVTETNAILQRLQTNRPDAEALKNAVFKDKRLWNAIAASDKHQLSQELVQDLLILQQFHQEKAVKKNDKNYGKEYNESIHSFYEKALEIRLSNTPIKAQATEIVDTAHRQFQKRHAGARLIADALMLVSILFGGLGLLIMVGRYATNRTVFFSNTVTDREQDLTTQMNDLNDLPDESPDDTNLFRPLIATPA